MKKFFAVITIIALILSVFSITPIAKGQPYEYFKSQLNADEQKIYEAFIQAAVLPQGEAEIPTLSTIQFQFTADTAISTNQQLQDFVNNNTACKNALSKLDSYFKNATTAMTMDHPEYYWLINSSLAELNYGFSSTGKDVSIVDLVISVPNPMANSATALSSVDSKLQSIGAQGTDLQKVKTIHTWLCNNVSYVSGTNSHNIYGALFEGKAVCQGYAEAFKAACDYYGVKCVCVEGLAINTRGLREAHMWNYVLINNTWYAIDVTWDDQTSGVYEDFYLVGSDTVATHFDNKAFKDTHSPDGILGGTAVKTFNYPILSQNAYAINNPTQAPTKAPTAVPTIKPTGTPNQNTPVNTSGATITQAPAENNVTPTPNEQAGGSVTPTIENTLQLTLEPTADLMDEPGIKNPDSTIIVICASAIGLIVVAAIVVVIIRKKR